MERTSPSFEVQDQSDRLISMLAWVVVAILVLYASVFFYKQAAGRGARGTMPSALAQAGAQSGSATAGMAAPPATSPTLTTPETMATPPVRANSPVAATQGMVGSMSRSAAAAGEDVSATHARSGTHVAVSSAAGNAAPEISAPIATASSRAHTAGGYCVHLGPFATWDKVFEKAKSIDTTAHVIQIAEEESGFAILLGHFPSVEDASAQAARMTTQGMRATVIPWRDTALDKPPVKHASAAIATTDAVSKESSRMLTATRTAVDGTSAATPTLSTAQPVTDAAPAASGERAAAAGTDKSAAHASTHKSSHLKRATDDGSGTADANSDSGSTKARRTAAMMAATHATTNHRAAATPRASDEGAAADTRPAQDSDSDTDTAAPRHRSATRSAERGTDGSALGDSEESESPTGSELAIQAGKFSDKDPAIAMAHRLKAKGWEPHVERVSPDDTDPYYRVRVGTYSDDARARKDAVKVAHDAGVTRVAIIRP